MADVIYNPLRSRLVLDARSRGIPAEGGLYMLVAQAVRASELFLDTVYPEDLTDRIYEEILRRKENVVLIGMPGSGKSAVGRILAGRTGWPLADTDQLVTEKAGKPIPDIFRLMNMRSSMGQIGDSKEAYAELLKGGNGAADCIHCRKCESVCPQHIKVSEELEMCAKALM